jgi:hypothetical protein
VTAAAILVSIILAIGSLLLVSRGLGGTSRTRLVRYGLIWGVIILGLVLILRVAGV